MAIESIISTCLQTYICVISEMLTRDFTSIMVLIILIENWLVSSTILSRGACAMQTCKNIRAIWTQLAGRVNEANEYK